MTPERIAVIGVGRIGAVTAVGLAHLEHEVLGVDRSRERVAALASGRLPEQEPGLRSALRAALRFRNLRFAERGRPNGADVAFLCVDTPPLPNGEPDLRQVTAAARDAAALLTRGGVLVSRATVPAGTGDQLAAQLRARGRDDIAVVHVPEFLREGHAWEDFREPDRIVIGGDTPAAERVAQIFAPLGRPLVRTDRRTAELAKYAANAYLATSISFANEIADLCAALGVDAPSVFRVLRADRRIGAHAHLTPGLGFGGHCLPKDTAGLERLGERAGVPLPLLHTTRQVNHQRTTRAVDWLRSVLGPLSGRRVCLAGLAFKGGTDDLRESPSLALALALGREGVQVTGWDPHVPGPVTGVSVYPSLLEAAREAEALVVAHAWSGWQDVDPGLLAAVMGARVVLDAPGILDVVRWVRAGFRLNHGQPVTPREDRPATEEVHR